MVREQIQASSRLLHSYRNKNTRFSDYRRHNVLFERERSELICSWIDVTFVISQDNAEDI